MCPLPTTVEGSVSYTWQETSDCWLERTSVKYPKINFPLSVRHDYVVLAHHIIMCSYLINPYVTVQVQTEALQLLGKAFKQSAIKQFYLRLFRQPSWFANSAFSGFLTENSNSRRCSWEHSWTGRLDEHMEMEASPSKVAINGHTKGISTLVHCIKLLFFFTSFFFT